MTDDLTTAIAVEMCAAFKHGPLISAPESSDPRNRIAACYQCQRVAAMVADLPTLKAHTDEAVEAAVDDYIENVQPAITNAATYQYQQTVADLHPRTAHWRQPRPDICRTCQVAYPCPTVAAVRAAATERNEETG